MVGKTVWGQTREGRERRGSLVPSFLKSALSLLSRCLRLSPPVSTCLRPCTWPGPSTPRPAAANGPSTAETSPPSFPPRSLSAHPKKPPPPPFAKRQIQSMECVLFLNLNHFPHSETGTQEQNPQYHIFTENYPQPKKKKNSPESADPIP